MLTESASSAWAAARRVLDTILATAQNRVELVSLEVQEEERRIVQALLCVMAIAVFGLFALALFTLLALAIFWEHGRLPALVVLTLAYLAAAFCSWRVLRKLLEHPAPFRSTIQELRKDRAALRNDEDQSIP